MHVLKKGCHSDQCYGRFQYIDSDLELPSFRATEDGIARLFVEIHRNKIFSQKGDLYLFNPDNRLWEYDQEDIKISKLLTGDFLNLLIHYCDLRFAQIDSTDKSEMKKIAQDKTAVQSIQRLNVLKHIIEFIKIHCWDGTIVLDENPLWLVTKDRKVFNILTSELVQCQPLDYMSDTQRLGVDWEPKNEVKIRFLKESYLSKLFTDESLRTSYLKLQSTSLKGGSAQREFAANLGTSYDLLQRF